MALVTFGSENVPQRRRRVTTPGLQVPSPTAPQPTTPQLRPAGNPGTVARQGAVSTRPVPMPQGQVRTAPAPAPQTQTQRPADFLGLMNGDNVFTGGTPYFDETTGQPTTDDRLAQRFPNEWAQYQQRQPQPPQTQAPAPMAPRPQTDLNQDWLRYQAQDPSMFNSDGTPRIRKASMDQEDFADMPVFSDNGPKYRWAIDRLVQLGKLANTPAARAGALQELEQTGDFLYRPGEQRSFEDGVVSSYNMNDPAMRAALTQASQTGDARDAERERLQNALRFTPQGAGTSQGSGAPGGASQSGYSVGPGPVQPSPTVPAQFSDPITSLLEQFAQQRAQQLENPQEGSGQQLLEQFLRQSAGEFQAPSAGSGQGLLESRLRSVADQIGNPQAGSGQALLEAALRGDADQYGTPDAGSGQGLYEQLLRGDVDRLRTPGAGSGTGRYEQALSDEAGQLTGATAGSGQALLEQALREQAAQFGNPAAGSGQQLLEAALRGESARLANPTAGSGQALYEQRLQEVAQQFGNGGYTPGELEIFQTQAIEPLEQLRKARKQQVMHQLATRGMDPNSGVALQMLSDVDRQMDASRTMTQRTLAADAARERTSRMREALTMLSDLAGTQDTRQSRSVDALGSLAGEERNRQGDRTQALTSLAGAETARRGVGLGALASLSGSEERRMGQATQSAGQLAGTEDQRRSLRTERLGQLSQQELGRQTVPLQFLTQLQGLESQRRTNAGQMFGDLANQENQRQEKAFEYRGFPLQLADRAFGQATQAYNAGGNPLAMIPGLSELLQQQNGRSDNWQEALGYLAQMLAGQNG